MNDAVLHRRVPRLPLASYPTPVRRCAANGTENSALWVKRDDLSSDVYGGNKVRKLEILLARARELGKTRLVTLGAVGSHQVVATALYGAREGFEVEAVLVPQPRTPHVVTNIEAAVSLGLRAFAAPAWALAPPRVAARLARGRDAFFVPLGGSSALSTLGYVEAAEELAVQVGLGELPEPDVAFVALGSGGTAAGLAVGFEIANLKTRVVGVATSPPAFVLAVLAKRLARKAARLAGLDDERAKRAAARIEVDGAWIGGGYGHATDAGRAAIVAAARDDLELDTTYTAKAFAAALAEVHRGVAKNVLYWHTLSSAPVEPLVRRGVVLPRSVASLLR